MLFDLEDYATTMRATTDALRWVNTHFDLGLTLPKADASQGWVIPKAADMIAINAELKTREPQGNYGGPNGAIFLRYTFEDFLTTAQATRDALVKAVFNNHEATKIMSKNINEIKARAAAINDFMDSYIELGPKWNEFWSACNSFAYYGTGLIEGDSLPDDKYFNTWSDDSQTFYQAPMKFKIMTQALYDDYFAALDNFMQKIKAILVLNGVEA